MAVKTDDQWLEQLQSPVAVLLGGQSSEREVSLLSGDAVLQALRAKGIEAVAIDTAAEAWLQTVSDSYRHVFIALHGGDGEDGTVQAALEKIAVSYTGSGVAASALAMDKVRCKTLWHSMGLATAGFTELSTDSDWQGIISYWGKMIVKPASGGSSLGMTIVNSAGELEAAYKSARKFDAVVMAEQWLSGAEYTVAILADKALPAIRMETDNSFYDYQAKYISEETRYFCPCGLDSAEELKLQALALSAFKSVGCSGWGRVDFMQDSTGAFYLLEVNTVPGMTGHSLVPMAAKAAGFDFEQLVTEILGLSLTATKLVND